MTASSMTPVVQTRINVNKSSLGYSREFSGFFVRLSGTVRNPQGLQSFRDGVPDGRAPSHRCRHFDLDHLLKRNAWCSCKIMQCPLQSHCVSTRCIYGTSHSEIDGYEPFNPERTPECLTACSLSRYASRLTRAIA